MRKYTSRGKPNANRNILQVFSYLWIRVPDHQLCSANLSSKKFLLVTDRGHYRKLQLVIFKRTTGCGTPSPKPWEYRGSHRDRLQESGDQEVYIVCVFWKGQESNSHDNATICLPKQAQHLQIQKG